MPQPLDNRTEKPPPGTYPAMVTTFRQDGAIDYEGVDRLTDFYIQSGVTGLFVCGLSAEIMWMDDEEKAQLAEHVVRRVAGRVCVVATAISDGSLTEQAELVRRFHATGADFVAISVCQLADENDDDPVWIQRAETFIEQVPTDTRLAFYECPLPYWRLLSAEMLDWVARSGRFDFLKDTCCDLSTIRTRLDIIRDHRLRLFNANTETLLASLQAGAHGFCGIGANYFPELYNWLCTHYEERPEPARELQQFLDTTYELTEGQYYPVTAKAYLRKQGLDIGLFSRKLPAGMTPEIDKGLDEMRIAANGWTERLAG